MLPAGGRQHRRCIIPQATKATNPPSEYVILTFFPRQEWSSERAPVLRYTYIACLVELFITYLQKSGIV